MRDGAYKVSITPDADEFPWTATGERPFVGVHDPIFAHALVMDDGSSRVALVELDLTSVPSIDGFDKILAADAARAASVPV